VSCHWTRLTTESNPCRCGGYWIRQNHANGAIPGRGRDAGAGQAWLYPTPKSRRGVSVQACRRGSRVSPRD
jgi:hypothetical protein